jgi:uncharacterized protein YajQ (UPF0234 family)
MPSFDVVSKTDLNEVDNALQNIAREIATRFDFKNSKSKIERVEAVLTLNADDQPKLKQMHELLKAHMVRRKIDPSALEFKDPERASGDMVRQEIIVKQGIDRSPPRSWSRRQRRQAQGPGRDPQGDELRISGKKRTICGRPSPHPAPSR